MNTSTHFLLQISAGTGPWEVRRFVAQLADALEAELNDLGLVVDAALVNGPPDAPSSIELCLTGVRSQHLQALVGTHALIARSPRRSKASRKRWFASVRLLEISPEGTTEVNPADVDFQATRAGGPGGQHVNTTASAVRAVHRPTGISVRVVSERSQHANRRIALARLGEALSRQAHRKLATDRQDRRAAHYALERGRPVRCWGLTEAPLTRSHRHGFLVALASTDT